MLKNPRALHTRYIFACKSNEIVYLRQNREFSQLLFAAIFLLNNVIGAMLSKNVGWFL